MKRFAFLLAAMLTINSGMTAQPDSFRKAFDEFSNRNKSEFHDFRQECNSQYAEFLERNWEEFYASPAVPMPDEREITPHIYTVPPTPEKDRKDIVPKEKILSVPAVEPQPSPVCPLNPGKPTLRQENCEFRIYGLLLKVRIGKRFSLPSTDRLEISKKWKTMGEFDTTLEDCLRIRDERRLCDWAYLNILAACAESYFGKSTNESSLLLAYLLSQSGYSTRLAVNEDELVVLYGSDFTIYEKSYYRSKGRKFYAWGPERKRLSICDFEFPGEKSLSMRIPYEQNLGGQEKTARGVSVPSGLLEFYSGYPSSKYGEEFMTRWALCAEAPMNEKTKAALYGQLKPEIEHLSLGEALNEVLSYVQHFEYRRDEEVWGYDRAFFAEETLAYPYSDCEDHAILFSHIVRDLLHLKVVLVYYPGHLATAVADGGVLAGDRLDVGGESFLVCDPTYENAPAGRTMKGMDNGTAVVIKLM